MRRYQAFAAAGLLAVAASAANAQQLPTVAVFGFNAFSVTLEDANAAARGLESMLTSELSARPEVATMDRAQIDEVLRRHQVSIGATGATDDAALEIGRLIGVNFMVTGSAAFDPRTVRLDLRMIEIETGLVVKSVKETGAREEMLDLVERVADQLVTDLELPERPAVLAVEIPVAASLAYSRGLDYERRGRNDRAQAMYRRALEVFPQHPHAQNALERVD